MKVVCIDSKFGEHCLRSTAIGQSHVGCNRSKQELLLAEPHSRRVSLLEGHLGLPLTSQSGQQAASDIELSVSFITNNTHWMCVIATLLNPSSSCEGLA